MLATKGLRLGQLRRREARRRTSSSRNRSRPTSRPCWSSPISDLNLSVRARKCMIRLGINTIGELVRRTGDDLLECKNFGVTSLNEVREKLTVARPEAPRRLTAASRSSMAHAVCRRPITAHGVCLLPWHTFAFELHHVDAGSAARRSTFHTPHGASRCRPSCRSAPRARVKGLEIDQLRADRRGDGPGQHLSSGAAARRRGGRGAGRAAPLHGLGRPDPDRQRRLPALQPGPDDAK